MSTFAQVASLMAHRPSSRDSTAQRVAWLFELAEELAAAGVTDLAEEAHLAATDLVRQAIAQVAQ